MLTLLVAVLGFSINAQAPQTGVYRIQNVGGQKYVKVTGKYDAQLVESQQDASYITVGIEKKLSDGTYKVNSLASTYGENNTQVEVYDYIPKALTLAEAELRKILKNSSDENIKKAIARMHELAEQYAFMRMMPVDGQADTYHAIAVLPYIPKDIVDAWEAKVDYDGTMWDWCKQLVLDYLSTHGTDAGLAARIRNNLAKIHEGHTYMLTADADGSFGYIETGANIKDETTWETTVNSATLTSSNNRSYWKLTPKVNTDNVQDGTYKIRNLGTKKYVSIKSKYYAKPDAEEGDASDIRITIDGEAYGGQKIVNLGGEAPDGTNIEIYDYIKKAIMIGKTAIYNVLTEGDGVNPASPEHIEKAQNFMENFVKNNAFMCMKPVPDKDDAVYAYAYIPEIPVDVVEAMVDHIDGVNNAEDCWNYGVNYVKQYLKGGTDNTLKAYILANIDRIHPNTTYYLSAHPTDGTFDFAAEGEADLSDEHFMWGFDVEDIEEDNLTSGTYKIRNVETGDYVEVLSKYYAKPDTDEENATEIHITYNGKLDDGSYKVTNMSAVAKDDSQCDIQSYVDKAIMLGRAAIADVLSGEVTLDGETVHVASPENIKKAQDFMEKFVRESAFMRVKPVIGTNYVYAIATIPEIPTEVVDAMVAHIDGVNNAEDCWNYGKQYVLNYLDGHPNSTLVSLITNNLDNLTPGHTYYLSEDDNQTFGYVDTEDPNFSLSNERLQWGIDLEEEDQPVESDFYKIHNVGNDLYVKVQGRYYAAPDADEASATPIAVTIDGMLEDGSMKVTNLVGDGHDIQKYVDHAIEIGTALIHQILDSQSSDENIQRAIEEMTNFVKDNAYMRVKLVPGETDAYYAYVVLPTVPQYIVDEWEKKFPNYNGTMRDWAVKKVKDYLEDHPQVDPKLRSMILNNIDKLYEGHTYYLRADGDKTFGIGDFTNGEVDLTDQYYWWGFADTKPEYGETGFFRIRNAEGVNGKSYVNVKGAFKAIPNLTAEEADYAPGSIIYVKMDYGTSKGFPITNMRSQGVALGTYIELMNTVLDIIPGVASQMADQFLAENSKWRALVEPAVATLISSVDKNIYAEATYTSNNEPAYFLKASVPDLNQYADLAVDALSFMNHTPDDLVVKIENIMEGSDSNSLMYKLLQAAKEMAEVLGEPNAGDAIWAILKQKANTVLTSEQYSDLITGIIPEDAINLIKNNLNKINHGTTYCLSEDASSTLDFMSYAEAKDKDIAKWVFVPFEKNDTCYSYPNYDEAHAKLIINANDGHTQNSLEDGTLVIGDMAQFATTYLDFDAKILTQNASAHKLVRTYKSDTWKYEGNDVFAYMAELVQVATYQNNISALTPVVLKAVDTSIELFPTGDPTTNPAVESKDAISGLYDKLIELGLLPNDEPTQPQGVPSPKAISENTSGNMLRASLLGDEPGTHMVENEATGEETEQIDAYLPLKQGESIGNGIYMKGLGFWNDPVEELEPNTAYLMADDAIDYTDGAPGYIFAIAEDGTITAIEAVNTATDVKQIRYYNIAGIESSEPFEGVNIVVTTYTDGSKSVNKILR